jgi:large conductance mechanosensitive channel
LKGFKDFVMRGNLVELAVAFIMAAAFAAVVTTFTNWLLSLIPAGATNFGDTQRWCPSSSSLRSSIFSSSPHTKKLRRVSGKQEAEASDPDDIMLLKEIRDLLASRPGRAV